jgi:NAD(P)-dependent dehydrogenase (short-subunit alcohol dehydrogenase family)
MQSLISGYRALVIGATGSIGSACVSALRADPKCEYVCELSRQSDSPLLLENEESISQAADAVRGSGPFELMIDATGALTIDGQGPEKSLSALDAERLMRSFQVNTIGPALVMKHFIPLLDGKHRAIYAKLSARVGSISDNKKGGWYGYRSAKAALNMMLQTAAIETLRKKPEAIFVALQPGTVASRLTTPFVRQEDCLTPEISAQGMLSAMDSLQVTAGAQFIDYAGNRIEW